MTIPRPVLLLVGLVAAYLSLTAVHAIGVAHADGVAEAQPAVAVAPAVTPVVIAAATSDTLAIIGIVLGGIALLLTGAERILAVIAPRTKTTIDDTALSEIREVLAFIRGLPGVPPVPSTVVNVTTAADQLAKPVAMPIPGPGVPRGSQTGRSVLVVMLVMVMMSIEAIGGMLAFAACDTGRARTAAGAGAFLRCEAPHVDAALLEEAKSVTIAGIEKWISGDGHVDTAGLKSAAAPLKSDLMRCAFDAAIAALATPPAKNPNAPMAAGFAADGAELRAKAEMVRAELGWPARAPGS